MSSTNLFANMTGSQFKAFIMDMGQDLTAEQDNIARDLADILLTAGSAAEDPIVRAHLIDNALAALADARDRLRVLWHASTRYTLAAAIAEDNGVPEALLVAEARQRLSLRKLDTVGMSNALAAETERLRLARDAGACAELACRNDLTDCADACCWHCGRGHRARLLRPRLPPNPNRHRGARP